MMREQDKEAVGYTDMRQFREWLRKAPIQIQMLAAKYPPSVYRLKLNRDMVRVCPERYYWNEKGELLMNVIVPVELNTHHPDMIPHCITDVDPDLLEPIKWPPDAEVH